MGPGIPQSTNRAISVSAADAGVAPQAFTHHRWAEIDPEQMNPQITRQYVTGTKTMLARIVLLKGAHVPLHSHPNEQVSHTLSGELLFKLEGREVSVRAGEVLCIPPNVPHEAFALADTVAMDVFNPPRQDWIDGDDAYLRGEPARPAKR